MPLIKACRIVSAPVAAAAYPKGKAIAPLVHAVFVNASGNAQEVLCGLNVDRVLGNKSLYNVEPLSCPECKRLVPPNP